MSLLIKALASAEKDKQAELSKKHGKASAADAISSLELSPKDDSKPDSAQSTSADVAEKLVENIKENTDLSLAKASFVDDSLSLVLEAGLDTHGNFEPKPAKPKAAQSPTKHKLESSKAKSSMNDGVAVSAATAMSSLASASATQPNVAPQKTAANVFVANQPVKSSNSKTALILLGVAGVLMIWLGIVGSRYISDLTSPEVVVVKPVARPPQQENPTVVANSDAEPVLPEPVEPPLTTNQNLSNTTANTAAVVAKDEPQKVSAFETETTNAADNTHIKVREEIKKTEVNQSRADGTESGLTQPASARRSVQLDSAKQATLQLTSRTPAAGVDPTLLSAYQALSRGDDASAQQQYRQVLQRDVRNIDALLGMAAIAQRQGREADAVGWYQKVLEIEPRNTIAQSAIVRPQANGDVVAAESRIKNMLAQQPEAANLHAALGHLYAEQNQWAAAQEAYFNASRFAPNSADYAFNLAISLDQLGKSGLALAQYRRALDLLNSSGASTPDRTQLESRIQALQASN